MNQEISCILFFNIEQNLRLTNSPYVTLELIENSLNPYSTTYRIWQSYTGLRVPKSLTFTLNSNNELIATTQMQLEIQYPAIAFLDSLMIPLEIMHVSADRKQVTILSFNESLERLPSHVKEYINKQSADNTPHKLRTLHSSYSRIMALTMCMLGHNYKGHVLARGKSEITRVSFNNSIDDEGNLITNPVEVLATVVDNGLPSSEDGIVMLKDSAEAHPTIYSYCTYEDTEVTSEFPQHRFILNHQNNFVFELVQDTDSKKSYFVLNVAKSSIPVKFTHRVINKINANQRLKELLPSLMESRKVAKLLYSSEEIAKYSVYTATPALFDIVLQKEVKESYSIRALGKYRSHYIVDITQDEAFKILCLTKNNLMQAFVDFCVNELHEDMDKYYDIHEFVSYEQFCTYKSNRTK